MHDGQDTDADELRPIHNGIPSAAINQSQTRRTWLTIKFKAFRKHQTQYLLHIKSSYIYYIVIYSFLSIFIRDTVPSQSSWKKFYFLLKKSFLTMATKVKPTTVKIRKNYIRMLDSFLYKVHFSKKL